MTNNFSQILIRTNENQDIPDQLSSKIQKIKELYPECKYTLYTNSMLREFISNHFDKDVLYAYDSLKPYAYKCDLGRYCVTYINGGWYADITTDFIGHAYNYIESDFICFYDAAYSAGGFGGYRWDYSSSFKFGIQNALFYTKKENVILGEAIKLIVENCKNKYYGKIHHMPTGPGCLAISYLLNVHKLQNVEEGMHVAFTPQHQFPNYSYILPNGEILAYYKNKSNQYYEFDPDFDYKILWRNKNIYGEND